MRRMRQRGTGFHAAFFGDDCCAHAWVGGHSYAEALEVLQPTLIHLELARPTAHHEQVAATDLVSASHSRLVRRTSRRSRYSRTRTRAASEIASASAASGVRRGGLKIALNARRTAELTKSRPTWTRKTITRVIRSELVDEIRRRPHALPFIRICIARERYYNGSAIEASSDSHA